MYKGWRWWWKGQRWQSYDGFPVCEEGKGKNSSTRYEEKTFNDRLERVHLAQYARSATECSLFSDIYNSTSSRTALVSACSKPCLTSHKIYRSLALYRLVPHRQPPEYLSQLIAAGLQLLQKSRPPLLQLRVKTSPEEYCRYAWVKILKFREFLGSCRPLFGQQRHICQLVAGLEGDIF